MTRYVIDPPDEIVIHAPNIKEIDGVDQAVRPDGNISLPLLGQVHIAGLSPQRAAWAVNDLASRYYASPDARVEVIAKSKFYLVIGTKIDSGKVPWTGDDTVLTVLSRIRPSIGPEDAPHIFLVRPERDGIPGARAMIDFKKLWIDHDLSQNYLIREGDIMALRPPGSLRYNFASQEETESARHVQEQRILDNAERRDMRPKWYLQN